VDYRLLLVHNKYEIAKIRRVVTPMTVVRITARRKLSCLARRATAFRIASTRSSGNATLGGGLKGMPGGFCMTGIISGLYE
jgi:hypothetical protein